ncbi:hypothetical protein HYV50_00415 [Candidatus Pacearchaeota archaeon]|nr:hypothetical protein [Candidatus Pacearchaeota archaeon]
MQIINTANIEEARKKIKDSKEKPIIVKAQDENFNRKILEYGKFDILLFPSQTKKKYSLKYMDSSLNHVLAKIATKNNLSIGFDMSSIKDLEKKQKAIELSRIRQNIKICRKAKTKIKILNYKDGRGVSSFLISLGASTQQAKEAVS